MLQPSSLAMAVRPVFIAFLGSQPELPLKGALPSSQSYNLSMIDSGGVIDWLKPIHAPIPLVTTVALRMGSDLRIPISMNLTFLPENLGLQTLFAPLIMSKEACSPDALGRLLRAQLRMGLVLRKHNHELETWDLSTSQAWKKTCLKPHLFLSCSIICPNKHPPL